MAHGYSGLDSVTDGDYFPTDNIHAEQSLPHNTLCYINMLVPSLGDEVHDQDRIEYNRRERGRIQTRTLCSSGRFGVKRRARMILDGSCTFDVVLV